MTTPAGRRVLDHAAELFYAHGITAVGVAGIAAAAGVTKKTLYDSFGSKAALVTAYLQRRHEQWWAFLQERLAVDPGVGAVFDSYAAVPEFPTDRGCAFQHAAAELPPDHPGMVVVRAHKQAVLAELVRLTGDVDRAEHLFLLLEGAAARRAVEGTPDALERSRRVAGV
ncbi:TetR/AcrR family transcriptional regulator [Actinomycetospora termitidis]|uniref:TetR/AcrR family transcriptional regulator n=1 Tax=Actinomycetospora termitidis TaxID=3053470 RepID=A0ABT7MEP9_9PSEU|nr:TetR/AcrR family transcriptional regulator [Actinomycetospora sp. Odt1-22]MDL5159138.1 TetR/AcrR family transcriptional regulator [Actinomycetospora sp. Odt1-22]